MFYILEEIDGNCNFIIDFDEKNLDIIFFDEEVFVNGDGYYGDFCFEELNGDLCNELGKSLIDKFIDLFLFVNGIKWDKEKEL